MIFIIILMVIKRIITIKQIINILASKPGETLSYYFKDEWLHWENTTWPLQTAKHNQKIFPDQPTAFNLGYMQTISFLNNTS